MIQVRQNVFETNSSSTHSITITTEDIYNAWRKGLVKFNEWSDQFTARKQMTDEDREACKQEYEANKPSYYKDWENLSEADKQTQYSIWESKHLETEDSDFKTFEQWRDSHSGCEFSTVHYTTEHGDKIVAFGCGGWL